MIAQSSPTRTIKQRDDCALFANTEHESERVLVMIVQSLLTQNIKGV